MLIDSTKCFMGEIYHPTFVESCSRFNFQFCRNVVVVDADVTSRLSSKNQLLLQIDFQRKGSFVQLAFILLTFFQLKTIRTNFFSSWLSD